MITIALIGAICLVIAQAFTSRHRPTRRATSGNVQERAFLLRDLAWAVASAILLTVFFSSHYFISDFGRWTGFIMQGLGLTDVLQWLGFDIRSKFLLLTAIAGLLVYAAGWIAGLRFSKGGLDFLAWSASGLVYGALVGLGAYLFSALGPYPVAPEKIRILLLSIIFGVPRIGPERGKQISAETDQRSIDQARRRPREEIQAPFAETQSRNPAGRVEKAGDRRQQQKLDLRCRSRATEKPFGEAEPCMINPVHLPKSEIK